MPYTIKILFRREIDVHNLQAVGLLGGDNNTDQEEEGIFSCKHAELQTFVVCLADQVSFYINILKNVRHHQAQTLRKLVCRLDFNSAHHLCFDDGPSNEYCLILLTDFYYSTVHQIR